MAHLGMCSSSAANSCPCPVRRLAARRPGLGAETLQGARRANGGAGLLNPPLADSSATIHPSEALEVRRDRK